MSEKTCETPSREISAKMKRLRLHTAEFRQNFDKEFVPLDRDDSFNTSWESDPGSPMRLITRASMCADESGTFQYSPLLRDGSISFPRSMTDPFIGNNSKRDDGENDEDVFDLADVTNDTPDKFSQLVTKKLVSQMPVEKRPKRIALSSLESFNDPPNKRNRRNGTTPTKLSCQNDDEANTDKIGDFSTMHSLPITDGPRGAKFKYLEINVLRDLLLNGRKDIDRVEIVDARYAYEFNGGHIKNAHNIASQGSNGTNNAQKLLDIFFDGKVPSFNVTQRQIMIFHCEFSSERGPRMFTILREYDRSKNIYPRLHWPEIYLLKGGYKDFWDRFKDDPRKEELFDNHGYVAMLDDENELNKVRKCRRRCRTAPPKISQKRLISTSKK